MRVARFQLFLARALNSPLLHRSRRNLAIPVVGNQPLIELQEGDTLLAIVDKDHVTHSSNVALSHAEFVKRSMGTLPDGAWVGTIRKFGDSIIALNSRTFFGNQLPAPQSVLDTIRGIFR
jgi:hypothetical protein